MARIGSFVLLVIAAIASVALAGDVSADAPKSGGRSLLTHDKFLGVWKVEKRQVMVNGTLKDAPAPGPKTGAFYIFSDHYASHHANAPITISYAGPWTLKGNTFTITIEVASDPAFIGQKTTRNYQFTATGRLIVSFPAQGLYTTYKKVDSCS